MNIGLCPYRKTSGRACSKLSRDIELSDGINKTLPFPLHALLSVPSQTAFSNCIVVDKAISFVVLKKDFKMSTLVDMAILPPNTSLKEINVNRNKDLMPKSSTTKLL